MMSVNSGIANLKVIGTDVDIAMCNGFKSFIPDLKLPLSVCIPPAPEGQA